MLLQYTHTYTYDGSGGPYNFPADWYPMNCAGYDTIAISVTSPTGWIGSISFWGGAGADQESPGLWSLNDAEDSSLTSQIESVTGATPSQYGHNFRGSIAGLAEFGVYFANPSTAVSAVGTITIKVGFYSSAK
jgi:hypothetical protein